MHSLTIRSDERHRLRDERHSTSRLSHKHSIACPPLDVRSLIDLFARAGVCAERCPEFFLLQPRWFGIAMFHIDKRELEARWALLVWWTRYSRMFASQVVATGEQTGEEISWSGAWSRVNTLPLK